jgi:cobalt-precorrin 5A hydrolase
LNLAFFSFTDRGSALESRLREYFLRAGREIFTPPPDFQLKERAAAAFGNAAAIFFIGAAGIAARVSAPFIRSKVTDPAVIVIDEAGKWVIPLLGGHIGGANELAREAARFLGAEAVITTATDINNVFAVDVWAYKQNMAIGSMEKAKKVSAMLLKGEEIILQSDYQIEGTPPPGIVYRHGGEKPLSGFGILVSMRRSGAEGEVLHLIPRRLYAGIGCRRGIAEREIADAFDRAIESLGLDGRCAAGAASVSLKKNEAGLLGFCESRDIPCVFFDAVELGAVKGAFSGSEFVLKTAGVDNVCERAAVLASGNGELLIKKTVRGGVTIAAAVRDAALCF